MTQTKTTCPNAAHNTINTTPKTVPMATTGHIRCVHLPCACVEAVVGVLVGCRHEYGGVRTSLAGEDWPTVMAKHETDVAVRSCELEQTACIPPELGGGARTHTRPFVKNSSLYSD